MICIMLLKYLSYALLILGSVALMLFPVKFPFATNPKIDYQNSKERFLGLNGFRYWIIFWLFIILGTCLQLFL